MRFRERLWTYALVTVVTLLIWYWAAAETRAQEPRSFRLAFVRAPQTEQIVSPGELVATVEMEGSRLALQRAADLAAGQKLVLTAGNELPTQSARRNLVELLESCELLTDTGATESSMESHANQITVNTTKI